MGFLDKTLDKLFGGGNAWKEEGWAAAGDTREWAGHHAVIDHAKKLGYPGFIAPAGSDKGTWTRFTNAFNAWKATKPWEKQDTGGGEPIGGGDSGGGGILGPTNSAGDPIGPYPYANVFFPQLTQAYEKPEAMNLSRFLNPGRFSENGGLLGQTWTQEYEDKYGSAPAYAPPQLNVGRPTFSPNATGLLQFGTPGIPPEWLEYLGPADAEKKTAPEPRER